MKSIKIHPIGIIHSPFTIPEGTPIQPGGSTAAGEIEIFDEYLEGLTDLEGFSHIIVLFHFHKIEQEKLIVKPYMDSVFHGIFSTRSPARPNRIGFSIVRLDKITGNKLFVRNLDMLDETPVIDIKPFVPSMDFFEVEKTGWLEDKVHRHKTTKDDGRFI
ncbi:MAG: tRNA (N6-threonylcarbamoyladenosine(37)-N6)-methyltransferase TrmO [Mariniphaga sp.]|nr:tRNA (N6-threonylcarbamoyladenosine(37)-N6)-methyltransferase TrmO [Mariniphaga sp.]